MNRDLDPISGRAVFVALNVGLLELLSKTPQSLETLAQGCDCSPRGLRPLLHLLTSVDLVRLQGSGFVLAPGAKRYIQKKWRKAWEAFPVIPEYEDLEKAVRYGRPVRLPVEGSADEGEFFSNVVPALFELHWPDASHLAEQIPSTVKKVLDLGAGSAVWSLALACLRPEVRVVAVDRAKVLDEVTSSFLAGRGVTEQYELRPGDYHSVDLEPETYDLVYLGHLLHADGWELSRLLLSRAHSALSFGGYVVVAEILDSEPRGGDYAASVFDLSMLMLTENGVVFTAPELAMLVAEAGFEKLVWVQGPGDYPVVMALKGEA